MVHKIKELTKIVKALGELMTEVTSLIGLLTLVVLAAKTLIELLIQ